MFVDFVIQIEPYHLVLLLFFHPLMQSLPHLVLQVLNFKLLLDVFVLVEFNETWCYVSHLFM